MFRHRRGRISWPFSIFATPISYISAFRLRLVFSMILARRSVHSFGRSSILNMLMLLPLSRQVWRLSRIPMMKDIFPHNSASWVRLNGVTKIGGYMSARSSLVFVAFKALAITLVLGTMIMATILKFIIPTLVAMVTIPGVMMGRILELENTLSRYLLDICHLKCLPNGLQALS